MADNGFIFSDSVFLPSEIVTRILSYVPPRQLVKKCSLVCKNWNDIIKNNGVWITKMQHTELKSCRNLSVTQLRKFAFPWFVLYQICLKDPFEHNFLQNNCGQNKLKFWQIESPCVDFYNHKSGWWIENPPVGADALPECEDFAGITSCFSTSYRKCEKKQLIDLRKKGISGYVMDQVQPKIIASEWYAGRYDCGCIYELTVSLLDEKKDVLIAKKEGRNIKQSFGRKWEKVVIEFENYGSGVRFILFNHFGKDTKCWADQYGSKMSGGVVKLSLS